MHQLAIAAWADDVQQSQDSPELPLRRSKRRNCVNAIASPSAKARRLALTDVSAHASNMASRDIKKGEVNRRGRGMRTLSPGKAQNPSDNDEAENLDFDSVTPRAKNTLDNRPIPILKSTSIQASSTGISTEPTTSSTPSSPARSRSPKRVILGRIGNGVRHLALAETLDDVQTQLGHAGKRLYSALRNVGFGEQVLPAGLAGQLAGKIDVVMDHWLDKSDERSIKTLHHELEAVQTIVVNSKRCIDERDHECEWNSIVHTPVLGLALGYITDECLGFRNVYVFRLSSFYNQNSWHHQHIHPN